MRHPSNSVTEVRTQKEVSIGIEGAPNSRGIATARGGEWTAVQVAAILHRVRA
jgi:hypothetical protein